MKTLFRIDSSGKEGHETEAQKKQKLKEYIKMLKKEYKKVTTKEVKNPLRRGKFVKIICE